MTATPSPSSTSSFTPVILGGLATLTSTPTPRDYPQSLRFSVFDWAGRQVWESADLPAEGASGIAFSSQLFNTGPGQTVTFFSGSASQAWDGKSNKGFDLPTGDYLVKVRIRERNGSEAVYSATLTLILKGSVLLSSALLYPMPAKTQLTFDLSQVQAGIPVLIEVWSLAGELVKSVTTLSGPTGKTVWNLSTGSGSPISSGVYVVVMKAEGSQDALIERRSFKMVVVRN